MDKADLEKYGFIEEDEITENDIFLIEHHENLFYLNPLELAKAINAMGENELLLFNKNVRHGYGNNADLMRDKLDELCKYMNVNMRIFGAAVFRTFSVNDHDTFLETEAIFAEKGKRPNNIELLFRVCPSFRTHYDIMKSHGVIEESVPGHLKWNKDKIALGEYFEWLQKEQQRKQWAAVELVFGVRNLRQYLHNHKEMQRGKPSKDFEEIMRLLKE
jgi:hypothetical protein